MRFYKLCVDGTNSFFTYCDENDEYKIGDRVAVNFRGKEHGALIIELENKNEFEFKVLPIKRKLTNEISLDETYMKMLLWVRNYYMCKFEQILKAAIPSDLKIKYDEVYKLTEIGRNDYKNPIVNYFLEREQVTKPVLRKHFSNEFIKSAVEKNILTVNMNKKICYNFKSELNCENINFSDDEDLKKLKDYFIRKSEMIKTSLENKFSKKDIEKLVKYCYTEQGNMKYQIENSVTFELDTVNEVLKVMSKVFLYIGIGFAVFAMIMLSNFIATSISYKKQEIGILRAIGARSNDVFRIFFLESFIIAMINFVLSTIGTGVATAIINGMFRKEAGILITILNFGPRQILLLLVISIGVAAVASFIPVYKIASKRPIEAIRNR